MKLWHKICVGLGTLILLAAFAWAWDLWTWSRGAQSTLAESRLELSAAQAQVEAVRAELNQATTTITLLQKRRTNEPVKIREVPADCVQCFQKHKISVSTASAKGWWEFTDPDVLDGEPGVLALTPRFWDDVVGPWKTATEGCEKALKACQGKTRPKLLTLDYRTTLAAGIGTDGYRAEARFEPIRFGGRRFAVGPWAEVGSSLGQDGLLRAWGVAGIEVQLGK